MSVTRAFTQKALCQFSRNSLNASLSRTQPSLRSLSSTTSLKMPNKHNHKDNGAEHIDKDHSEHADEPHQFQSGTSTHREEDQWKKREPYRIHDDDEKFPVKWKGKCHCGKIQYQLKREKPLASKFCHCTTCQRLHGVSQDHVFSTING